MLTLSGINQVLDPGLPPRRFDLVQYGTQCLFNNPFKRPTNTLGPGIYVSLTILGAGGGPASATTMQNIVNSVLYGVYFFVGLISGAFVNTIGPKWTLLIGSFGYPVYVGGLWYFTDYGQFGYPIFGGACLGICAALLWTAAGYMAYTYSVEHQKGRHITMEWATLSVGSTITSLMAFGINFHATAEQVPVAVYIVFILLMLLSSLIAGFLIIDPEWIRRTDGSFVKPNRQGWLVELKGQAALFRDWRMFAMLIPFFASEIAIIIIGTLNSSYFDIRTRSLNSVFFNLMQVLGAFAVRPLLDYPRSAQRRTRGLVATGCMGAVVVVGWIWLVVWLYRNPLDPLDPPLWDWTEPAFGGFFVLNLLFGINMVTYQVVAQWIAATLSQDPETLARIAGFAKGGLAGGLACTFGIEASSVPQLHVMAFGFTLQAMGLVCMVVVCLFAVKQPKTAPKAPVVEKGPVTEGPRKNWALDKHGCYDGSWGWD